uniref:Uncharacterized protein n=1 Tax=Arundo donax TaxID=35708 RepID=A0A0A9FR96_ARUDO
MLPVLDWIKQQVVCTRMGRVCH